MYCLRDEIHKEIKVLRNAYLAPDKWRDIIDNTHCDNLCCQSLMCTEFKNYLNIYPMLWWLYLKHIRITGAGTAFKPLTMWTLLTHTTSSFYSCLITVMISACEPLAQRFSSIYTHLCRDFVIRVLRSQFTSR